MANYDCDSLSLMYNLLNRVDDGVQPIIKELENHILSRGKLGLKNTNLNDGESLGKFFFLLNLRTWVDLAKSLITFLSDDRFLFFWS